MTRVYSGLRHEYLPKSVGVGPDALVPSVRLQAKRFEAI